MGTRDNNGVRLKIINNAGAGSVERGGGQAGAAVDQSHQRGAGFVNGSDSHQKLKMADMASHHGPKGSSGTEKHNGGVGDMGAGERRDFFRDEH